MKTFMKLILLAVLVAVGVAALQSGGEPEEAAQVVGAARPEIEYVRQPIAESIRPLVERWCDELNPPGTPATHVRRQVDAGGIRVVCPDPNTALEVWVPKTQEETYASE